MKLKSIFNKWANQAPKDYLNKQWLLSKWEVIEGIDWSDDKINLMIKSIVDGLRLNSNCSLVDLGCGGGWILNALARHVEQSCGLDISQHMLKYARENCKDHWLVCGEMGRLPLKSCCFDRVLSYYVFLNFDNDDYIEKSLLEIFRILKKEGRALIGQLADEAGSQEYEQAKTEYLEFCRRTYEFGNNNRDIHAPPLGLFSREKIADFLHRKQIKFHFRDSFNPFYRPGQPELIPWRFDVILEKD